MKLPTLFLCAAALALPARAGTPAAETRPATDTEIAAFAAYYKAGHADAPPALVTATRAGRNWSLTASVDENVRRGAAPLCRMARTHHAYDAARRRWAAAGPDEQFAWLGRGAACVAERPILQYQQLPDAELIPLLEQQGVLLLQSRLLMAGNSGCAVMRSYRFRLRAVNVSAPPGGAEALYELVYASDRDTAASLWLKKIKGVYHVWNVGCGPA